MKATSLSLIVVPCVVGEVLLMALGRIAFEPVDSKSSLGRSEEQPITPSMLEAKGEKLPAAVHGLLVRLTLPA